MRLARWAVSALLAVGLTMNATAARAADPEVEESGPGRFRGSAQVDHDKGRGSKGKGRKPAKPGDSPRDQRPRDPDPCGVGCAGLGARLDRDAAEQYVRQLIVHLQLPTPTPQFGPDPSVNEWNMLAVGYPIWLWTDGPQTVTASESAYGYTFTLRATYRSTTFTMGDGHTKQCTTTTPYRSSVTPGATSPTCGYTYQQAAPKGSYTVTATTHWEVAWSVAGYSGTLPGTHSASRELPIGELQAIRVK